MDIKRISQKIEAAQEILNEIRIESGCEAFDVNFDVRQRRQETALEVAERAYRERRSRSNHFKNQQIFGEPAWDILLDLYIRQCRDEQVTVRSAIVRSGTTEGAAERWLTALDREGLIYSEIDPTDGRRYLLRLTPEGFESITHYMQEVARSVQAS